MKTFWSFVAGGVAVAFLCAASGVQKEWDVYSVETGVIPSDGSRQRQPIGLPGESEVIGSHIIKDGSLNNLVIIYRVPKK